MSASAAPMVQSIAAAPAQYVYASQPQGAAVPMEPVAGQPMIAGQGQVTYQTTTMGASSVMQAGGQVTYSAPQATGQVMYSSPQVISQGGQSVSYVQPGQEGQTVTYLTQPGQEVQTAPAQYITAPAQYVTPAQPQQVMQEPGGAVTYAAPTYVQGGATTQYVGGQSYTVQQGATTQYATLPSSLSMVAYPGAPSNYFPMNVQQAWDNHFSAFGAKDVEKIILDYDETSVIRVYTSSTGQLTEFCGTMQIREFFAGVFRDLADMSTLEAPVQIVEEDYKQVFLVWKCPSSGVTLASDTFIFGPDHKIKRQNITLDKKAGFVVSQPNANSMSMGSGRMGASMSSGRMNAQAMGATPGSMGADSAKASKKKKDSKKKLSSKKKAKSGFC